MQRMAILALAILITLFVAIQLALPPLIAGQVEKQLTKHGGHANVELKAFPSPRLLFKEGDSLSVKATGLVAPPADPTSKGTLNDLDGFDEVDIQVVGMHVGPLTVARLTLTRKDGSNAYEASVQATVTAAALSTYAGGQIGGGLGGFLGGIAGSAMPGATVEIPIDIGATLRSEEGAVRTVNVTGSIAGLPAGPFVEALIAAVAGRF
jgi:hypothetical protein